MAYKQNLSNSARRHLASANRLYEENSTGHKAVAGYLFGLAGELALKKIMLESNMKPLSIEERRNDPFFAHFPDLCRILRATVKGRRQGEILKHLNSNIFQHWNTDMRYAPTVEIKADWVDSWKKQAEKLISEMGL